MKIHFCGAAREVTGTRHLLEVSGKKILLDCGMVQGRRKDAKDKNEHPLFLGSEVDAVILSHAHIDHSGILPVIWKSGFRGKIYATSATADIVSYMLHDSAHIQEMDAKFLQKHRGETISPLYTKEDADSVLELLEIVPYWETVKVTPELSFRFIDAGHILGSAEVEITIQEKDKTIHLGFTGDLGRKNLPIIRDPEYLQNIDTLICESTYGNRLHHDFPLVCSKFAHTITETVERGGKVIIPTFALERAQEIVYVLHQLLDEKKIPDVPIYVDSPLTANLFDVFHRHGECYDEEIKEEFIHKNHNPFRFKNLKLTKSVAESKQINASKDPAIILSASGMCETGRILHHLASTIGHERNTIVFVGYQALNTLGRKIIEGETKVRIFGEYHSVRAKIESFKEFSAHADYKDILDFLEHIPSLKKIFLVHGEDKALNSLSEKIQGLGKNIEVVIPSLGDKIEI